MSDKPTATTEPPWGFGIEGMTRSQLEAAIEKCQQLLTILQSLQEIIVVPTEAAEPHDHDG